MNIIPRRQIPQGANLYRVVLVITRNGVTIDRIAFEPTTKWAAMQNWRWRIASGLFGAHSGHSVRVMSLDACRKAGIR